MLSLLTSNPDMPSSAVLCFWSFLRSKLLACCMLLAIAASSQSPPGLTVGSATIEALLVAAFMCLEVLLVLLLRVCRG